MIEFYQEHDIIHEVIAFYTPQSNCIAERKNRALMEWLNACYSAQVHLRTFGEKLSFLSVSFSIWFPKETHMLLPLNVEKEELLISNSLKYEIAW